MTTDAERFDLEYGIPVQEFIRNYVKDAETHQLVSKELRKMRDLLIVQECETMAQEHVAARWGLTQSRVSQILKAQNDS
jgi:predicted XRE-type DNA-binding protein